MVLQQRSKLQAWHIKYSIVGLIALIILVITYSIANRWKALFGPPPFSIKGEESLENSSIIFIWTSTFDIWTEDHIEPCVKGEPVCGLTSRREYLDRAKVVVFHATDIDFRNLPPRKPNQPWVLWTQESPISVKWMAIQERMSLFDYTMTYRLDSDFPVPYFRGLDYRRAPVPLANKFETPVGWIAGNCDAHSGRTFYLKELMQYISIDSYGTCLHNREFPSPEDRANINSLISKYKFYIAMENSQCHDYVTEKLARCLELGVVPIVDGPKTLYEKFMPTEKSMIFISDFATPKELADFILYLNSNDTAYLEYLSFKDPNVQLSKLYQGPLNNDTEWGFCYLCAQINRGALHTNPSHVKADTSCEKPRYADYDHAISSYGVLPYLFIIISCATGIRFIIKRM